MTYHPQEAQMKTVDDRGDTVALLCVCGTEFIASPCGEDNCYWTGSVLVPQCPGCLCIRAKPRETSDGIQS